MSAMLWERPRRRLVATVVTGNNVMDMRVNEDWITNRVNNSEMWDPTELWGRRSIRCEESVWMGARNPALVRDTWISTSYIARFYYEDGQ